MTTTGIDQDAITKLFSEATAKQGEALRKGVSDATLKALQGRELTVENIRKVLETVTTAASKGAAKNESTPADVEAMLNKAIAGMDGALLKTVEANRRALQQFVDRGATLRETQLKAALASLEKMEDTFFASISKAVEGAGNAPVQTPWSHVLEKMKSKGTESGTHATETVQSLLAQTRSTLRTSRASNAKAAQAMLDGYAALVSGVLLGMSEGLQGTSASPRPAKSKAKT